MLIITYFISFIGFSIGSSITQKINDYKLKHKKDEYYTSGIISIMVLALVGMALAYIFNGWLLSIFKLTNQKTLFFFCIPLIFLRMQKLYFTQVLAAHLKLKAQTIIDIIAYSSQIILSIILILLGLNLFGIFIGIYVAEIISLVGKIFFVHKIHKIKVNKNTITVTKDLFYFSTLIYLGSIAVVLDSNIDIFFINHFLMKEDVAIYNYAIKIAFLLLIVGYSISKVTYPLMTRAFSSGAHKKIKSLYSKSLNLSFLVVSFLALAIIFNINFLVSLMLPPIYFTMRDALVILFIGMVIFATINSIGCIFTAKGKLFQGSLLIWLSLIINIELNIILIPKYGMVGAAIATTSSFILRAVFILPIPKSSPKL